MKNRFISTLTITLVAAAATFSHADMAVKGPAGVMVNGAGLTVYTFDKDVAGSGKSSCNGACSSLWPAIMASSDARPNGDMSIVTRDDGSKQWAYKGKPLYRYSADAKPGDKMGDNFKDLWHLLKP